MGKRPAEGLYHVKKDPACMHNFAADPKCAASTAQLWENLRRTLTVQHDPRILGHEDVFDKYPYQGNRKNAWDTIMGKDAPHGSQCEDRLGTICRPPVDCIGDNRSLL
jgi:hypothetical protein